MNFMTSASVKNLPSYMQEDQRRLLDRRKENEKTARLERMRKFGGVFDEIQKIEQSDLSSAEKQRQVKNEVNRYIRIADLSFEEQESFAFPLIQRVQQQFQYEDQQKRQAKIDKQGDYAFEQQQEKDNRDRLNWSRGEQDRSLLQQILNKPAAYGDPEVYETPAADRKTLLGMLSPEKQLALQDREDAKKLADQNSRLLDSRIKANKALIDQRNMKNEKDQLDLEREKQDRSILQQYWAKPDTYGDPNVYEIPALDKKALLNKLSPTEYFKMQDREDAKKLADQNSRLLDSRIKANNALANQRNTQIPKTNDLKYAEQQSLKNVQAYFGEKFDPESRTVLIETDKTGRPKNKEDLNLLTQTGLAIVPEKEIIKQDRDGWFTGDDYYKRVRLGGLKSGGSTKNTQDANNNQQPVSQDKKPQKPLSAFEMKQEGTESTGTQEQIIRPELPQDLSKWNVQMIQQGIQKKPAVMTENGPIFLTEEEYELYKNSSKNPLDKIVKTFKENATGTHKLPEKGLWD